MSRPKLLLADDSITIQKVVNLTFADHGMDVVTFADGDAAIENFDQVKPDIVLADVNMPGINGYQLCELLRSDAASSNIPIVLLVGSFEPFDREEAERVGASAHLTKPFSSIAQLVSTVEGLLAPPQKEADAEPAGELESALGTEPAEKPGEKPGPDTTDIDSLYAQSFVETVEIPREAVEGYEFEPADLDDEMIQTSYVGDDPSGEPDLQEAYSFEDGENSVTDFAQGDGHPDTGSLMAESMPQQEEQRPQEPERELSADGPAHHNASDPFAAPAAELPPISDNDLPVWQNSAAFDFDDSDLLELPGPSPVKTESALVGGSANPGQITTLSPELIDLIVDKVVERLAQRNESSEKRTKTYP